MTRARFVAGLDFITDLLCTLFGIVLGLIIVLLCADIVLRNIGITSLPWVVELAEYALYGGTFLAAPKVLRMGSHVRVEILHEVVARNVARRLDQAADIAGLATSMVMFYYGMVVLIDSYRSGMIQFKSLIISEWILLLPIPIGCALLSIEFLLRLFRVRTVPADADATSTQFSI